MEYLFNLPRDTFLDLSTMKWYDEEGEHLTIVLFTHIDGMFAEIIHNKKVYHIPSYLKVPYEKKNKH